MPLLQKALTSDGARLDIQSGVRKFTGVDLITGTDPFLSWFL